MKAYAVVDLQFGSTGKGLLCGYLARTEEPDTVVCAFGPNAGHTFIDENSNKFTHIQMPMGVMSTTCKTVMFGPGAIIDPEILMVENQHLRDEGFNHYELMIHENATVVQERHREAEAAYGARIGSTQKGTGAALAEKITRSGANSKGGNDIVAGQVLLGTPLEGFLVSVAEYNDRMDAAKVLQIEGAQGFSLSCHHGFYPFVTSRDCTIGQLIADCAVPLRKTQIIVYGTCRTFPIRVNNKTGSSGPCYHDQIEIPWESIGQKPELTTVTKLPRRLFTFSDEQIRQAIRANGVDRVFLNFCNYLESDAEVDNMRERIGRAGAPVKWLGFGPKVTEVQKVSS